MDYKDCLTNEQLLKRFKNQFELVRYAIQIATSEIHANRDSFGPFDAENVAFETLSDIAAGSEVMREVPKQEPVFEAKRPEREEKKEKKAKGRPLANARY